MSKWKFTDATNRVVSRINSDGSVESKLVAAHVDVSNVPEPADAIIVQPDVPIVTPWQIRNALNATGLRGAVEAAVLAADQTTKDAWQYATEFRRDNALVAAVATALGKTEAELDAVFAMAQTVTL